MQVNIHEAKTQLSALLERVARGEEVIIAKAGKPVARLVGIEAPPRRARVPGSLSGQLVYMAPDFDETLPDDFLSRDIP